MKTLIIYLDNSKKNFHKITPFAQGPGFDSKTRFDDRWDKLVNHLYGDKHYRFEVI
jgi:hypothetical protein